MNLSHETLLVAVLSVLGLVVGACTGLWGLVLAPVPVAGYLVGVGMLERDTSSIARLKQLELEMTRVKNKLGI